MIIFILLFLGCSQLQNSDIEATRSLYKFREIHEELDPVAFKLKLNELSDEMDEYRKFDFRKVEELVLQLKTMKERLVEQLNETTTLRQENSKLRDQYDSIIEEVSQLKNFIGKGNIKNKKKR